MANIFEKFNQMIDGEALAKDVQDVAQNGDQGDYEEIPHGTYEVKIEKMEIKECKSEKNKGLPMLGVQFRILEGDHKNQCIFMNQLLVKAYSIHKACEFLRSLDSGVDVDFDGNYEHFNNTILDIHEKIDGVLEYELDYSQNNKGYNEFKINQVFEVEA